MPVAFTLTDYTYKYRSDAPTSLAWGAASFELHAMRRETVACQLVIRSDETMLAVLGQSPLLNWTPAPRLRVALGRWSGPDLQQPQTEAFLVGVVPADEGERLVADPLLRDESIEVPANCPQAVWLSIRFDAGAEPGRYTLPITLYQAKDFDDEQVVGRAQVTVNVHATTLPEPRDFSYVLDLWQHPSGLARGHGVPLWSEEHWCLIERYAGELARLGQKAITIMASDAPWAGQRCRTRPEYPSSLHEYNIIHIERGKDGELRFDFSRLDRYVEIYMAAGIRGEISIFGLLAAWDDEYGHPLRDHPDNIRLACHDQATGAITWLRTQAELRLYVTALCQHLRQRGWWDIVRFEADEPSDVTLFRQRVDFLKSVAPDARIKIPIDHIRIMEPFLDDVSDWVPQPEGIGQDVALFQRARATVRERGGRFSWYVCCNPARPNNFMTSPSIEARFQGWYTAWAGLDGFLRWAFTCWPADPWRRPAWRYPVWKSGDMFFVYPGRDGYPVRSLRTETLLMGIQDFELISLARQEASTDPVVQQALDAAFARVVRSDLAGFTNIGAKRPESLYSLDPADYDAARVLLISALETSHA